MGFVTIIERYPDENLLVVALSNLENSPIGSIGTDLAAIALASGTSCPARPRWPSWTRQSTTLYSARYEPYIPE